MKRIILHTLFLLLPLPAWPGDPPNVEKPSFSPGEEWGYRRIDLWKNAEIERWQQTVTRVVGDHVVLEWNVVDAEDESRRGSITEEFLDAGTLGFFDTKALQGRHVPLLFPLYPGKTWSFTYKFDPEKNNSMFIHQKARVEGWETVRVPAGEFRALKVVHTARYNMTDEKHYWGGYIWSGDIRETYWYAPGAKRVIRMEYSDTGYESAPYDKLRDELVYDRVHPRDPFSSSLQGGKP